MRATALLVAGAAVLAACGGGNRGSGNAIAPEEAGSSAAPLVAREFPPAPSVPDGPLAADVVADLDSLFATIADAADHEALARLGDSGDARVAWPIADILRFVNTGPLFEGAVASWEALTGVTVEPVRSHWNFTTDHLIAWDLPAPPGYADWKGRLYEIVEPGWAPFFADDDADIDWRLIAWGGVRIDDRPLEAVGLPCPRGCIPALDDPALTAAAEGDWYPDDRIVFGIELDGEAVAFPRNIMEVHEMINMTVAGRRIGMPYCTLCGSAQAWFTDTVPEGVDLAGNDTLELRTSGLLSRSNKVMFDLHTRSVFDTFTGRALSGPLHDAGVVLDQLTVRTTTWGDWKAAHPDTRIVAEDGGIGRTYDDDPLRGRDDDGPIFPIGNVDTRLPVQESVVGVVTVDGQAIAFPATAAGEALASGMGVSASGVALRTDGAGFSAVDEETGEDLAAHQAFWFAWSQFHPDTELWTAGES